jgi:ornithine decarboxylase
MYYVNDGVFGSLNCMLYDGAASLAPVPLDDRKGDLCYSCSIWGPTCDSLDCLTTYQLFPELEVGDWVLYENMGAYTQTASSAFNGMPQPKIHYIISEDLL